MANKNVKGRKQLIEDAILKLEPLLQGGLTINGVSTEATLEAVRLILVSISDTLTADGVLSLTNFVKDGVITVVNEDTGTPANNEPLPVKIASASGEVTITAGDLHVQLSHTGANPDSTRIGDGTNELSINADGSINVSVSTDVEDNLDALVDYVNVRAKYAITDSDSSSDPEYFGFVAKGGEWYILEIELGNIYRYFNGVSDYTTGWTNRASHSYVVFNALTW